MPWALACRQGVVHDRTFMAPCALFIAGPGSVGDAAEDADMLDRQPRLAQAQLITSALPEAPKPATAPPAATVPSVAQHVTLVQPRDAQHALEHAAEKADAAATLAASAWRADGAAGALALLDSDARQTHNTPPGAADDAARAHGVAAAARATHAADDADAPEGTRPVREARARAATDAASADRARRDEDDSDTLASEDEGRAASPPSSTPPTLLPKQSPPRLWCPITPTLCSLFQAAKRAHEDGAMLQPGLTFHCITCCVWSLR